MDRWGDAEERGEKRDGGGTQLFAKAPAEFHGKWGSEPAQERLICEGTLLEDGHMPDGLDVEAKGAINNVEAKSRDRESSAQDLLLSLTGEQQEDGWR